MVRNPHDPSVRELWVRQIRFQMGQDNDRTWENLLDEVSLSEELEGGDEGVGAGDDCGGGPGVVQDIGGGGPWGSKRRTMENVVVMVVVVHTWNWNRRLGSERSRGERKVGGGGGAHVAAEEIEMWTERERGSAKNQEVHDSHREREWLWHCVCVCVCEAFHRIACVKLSRSLIRAW